MKIIPALLNHSASELNEQIDHLLPYFTRFQIDIADGIFVNNKTVQIEEITTTFKHSNTVTKNIMFDFHLMVKDYKKEIKKLEQLKNFINLNIVFIHYSVLNTKLEIPNKKDFTTGLVLNPSDEVSNLARHYDLDHIKAIQIMSVTPGWQGQAFIPETLSKIEQLRRVGYKSDIFIDGSINNTTIPIILKQKFQPNYLCIGSYLTKAEGINERVKSLNQLLNKRSQISFE